MSSRNAPTLIRDPIWGSIRLDATATGITDAPAFQRLRYIRQLGLAHLVYPGATHTRFAHALGVYHLVSAALRSLRKRESLPDHVWEGAELVPYAGLLHDIGHYPFSHALDDLRGDDHPGDHEAVAAHFLESPEVREALAGLGRGAAAEIGALIRGESTAPLRGLVHGSLDMDKMDYLKRDARSCGVPYGEVDVERLLQGLVILQDPESGAFEVGVDEKAVTALESLLFAKYQMFRNVYWHHAVRAGTVLCARIVNDAVAAGLVGGRELAGPTDDELLHLIGRRAQTRGGAVADRIRRRWLPALRARRLPKRAAELTAADLGDRSLPPWIEAPGPERRRLEDQLAEALSLEPGEVVIDFPCKPAMFQLDLLVRRRSGRAERLGKTGIPGVIDLPRVARELYRTSRVLRVFTLEKRSLAPDEVISLVTETNGNPPGERARSAATASGL